MHKSVILTILLSIATFAGVLHHTTSTHPNSEPLQASYEAWKVEYNKAYGSEQD